MTVRKPSYTPEPRRWNEQQVAAWWGRSVNWFRSNRPILESEGFPLRDPLFGGWDSRAINDWMDRRSGLSKASLGDELTRELAEWQP